MSATLVLLVSPVGPPTGDTKINTKSGLQMINCFCIFNEVLSILWLHGPNSISLV